MLAFVESIQCPDMMTLVDDELINPYCLQIFNGQKKSLSKADASCQTLKKGDDVARMVSVLNETDHQRIERFINTYGDPNQCSLYMTSGHWDDVDQEWVWRTQDGYPLPVV